MVVLLVLSLNFTATAGKTEVSKGVPFTVSVKVESEDLSGAGEPEPPEIENFKILGKSSSHSTQIQVTGGKMKKSTVVSYEYRLVASEVGEYTIPPFTLNYKGETYKTEPVNIKVMEDSAGVSKTRGQTGRGRVRPEEEKVFLECELSSNRVYPGQPVRISYFLYTGVNLSNVRLSELPEYEKVWVENLTRPGRLNFEEVTENGRRYSRALIKEDLLFPLGREDIHIGPLKMLVQYGGDVFSLFGESRMVSSKSRTVEVIPFPGEKPENFVDAVGEFKLSVEIDSGSIEAGKPFPLKLTLEGEGNIPFLTPPEIKSTPKIEIYEPESRMEEKNIGKTVRGKRIFTYLISPRSAGFFEIPGIDWSFFNPEKKKFEGVSLGPWRLRAKKSMSPVARENEGSVEDISYILPVEEKNISLLPDYFLLYFIIPFLILGVSLYYYQEKKRILSDSDYARFKAIPGELKSGFRRLENEIENGDEKEFYQEISRLLLKFTKLKFGVDTFGRMKKELLEELRNYGVGDELLGEMRNILKRSEEVRFAVGRFSSEDMEKDLSRLKRIINALC